MSLFSTPSKTIEKRIAYLKDMLQQFERLEGDQLLSHYEHFLQKYIELKHNRLPRIASSLWKKQLQIFQVDIASIEASLTEIVQKQLHSYFQHHFLARLNTIKGIIHNRDISEDDLIKARTTLQEIENTFIKIYRFFDILIHELRALHNDTQLHEERQFLELLIEFAHVVLLVGYFTYLQKVVPEPKNISGVPTEIFSHLFTPEEISRAKKQPDQLTSFAGSLRLKMSKAIHGKRDQLLRWYEVPYRWGDLENGQLFSHLLEEILVERLVDKYKSAKGIPIQWKAFSESLSQAFVTHVTSPSGMKRILESGMLVSPVFATEQGLSFEGGSPMGRDRPLADISFSFFFESQFGDIGIITPFFYAVYERLFYIIYSSKMSQFPELHVLDRSFHENHQGECKTGTYLPFDHFVFLLPSTSKAFRHSGLIGSGMHFDKARIEAEESFSEEYGRILRLLQTKNHSDSDTQLDKLFQIVQRRGIGGFGFSAWISIDEINLIKSRQHLRDREKMLNSIANRYYAERHNLKIINGYSTFSSGAGIEANYQKEKLFYSQENTIEYWNNLIHSIGTKSGSWLHNLTGGNVNTINKWIANHVIYYDRSLFLLLKKFNISHFSSLQTSTPLKQFTRLIRAMGHRYNTALLAQSYPVGKLYGTSQKAYAWNNKLVTLFKYA